MKIEEAYKSNKFPKKWHQEVSYFLSFWINEVKQLKFWAAEAVFNLSLHEMEIFVIQELCLWLIFFHHFN